MSDADEKPKDAGPERTIMVSTDDIGAAMARSEPPIMASVEDIGAAMERSESSCSIDRRTFAVGFTAGDPSIALGSLSVATDGVEAGGRGNNDSAIEGEDMGEDNVVTMSFEEEVRVLGKRVLELEQELASVREESENELRVLRERVQGLVGENTDLHMQLTEAKLRGRRRKLPDERDSLTRTFRIVRPNDPDGEFQMYVHVGLYSDKTPGEIFIETDKEGSFASGVLDAAATAASLALQYGVPIQAIASKWFGMAFEPAGMTGDPKYRMVRSAFDFLGRWLLDQFPLPQVEE